MRWLLGLLPFTIAAACGGVISGTSDAGDAGNDVATTVTKCSSVADCPKGDECRYPGNGGCGAKRQCFPPAPECKKLVSSCSCANDTMVSGDCNDAFQEPVTGQPCEVPIGCTQLACEICDASGFSPTPQSPPENATHACSAGDIDAFVAACLSTSATQATCTAWQNGADAGACRACILTETTSASWGPLVCDQNQCILDDGGCVDIVTGEVALEQSGGGKGSCGDLVIARDECIDYACAACTSPDDFTACQDSALQNECKAFSDGAASSPLCTDVDAGTSVCGPQNDTDFAAFINVFCGTGP